MYLIFSLTKAACYLNDFIISDIFYPNFSFSVILFVPFLSLTSHSTLLPMQILHDSPTFHCIFLMVWYTSHALWSIAAWLKTLASSFLALTIRASLFKWSALFLCSLRWNSHRQSLCLMTQHLLSTSHSRETSSILV